MVDLRGVAAAAWCTAAVLGQEAPTAPPSPETNDTAPQAEPEKKEPKLNAGTFGALSARGIGPALFSGRIGDIAVNPANTSEWYVVVSSGNVWKTTNSGVTFSPIFDGHGSYSVGCVTLDPSNPSTVWLGSGENNSQRSVGWGDGVYVSRDAGASFTNVGLKESEHIGRIVVDPRDSNVVYVAAQGPLWKSGGERGVYKTVDGGKTWERVLHISDETGVNEIHMDPRNPDVLYASAYQRRRHVWTLINGGPESGIHKSEDGGKTWRAINSGLPGSDKGRIGMAVSPVNPDVLYAIVEAANGEGGVFRSTTRGERWEKRSGYMTSSPQYYNELVADPKNADRVYALDTVMAVSDDGGATFTGVPMASVHVDSHALWIDPENTDHLILGNDGGLYESWDRANWRHFRMLPVTQFYRVAMDNSSPFYFVYGGTQDNSTLGGPSRTTDRAGITTEDWFLVVGGDGFEPAVDPEDPNIVYGQWQHGGLVRFDRRTGEEYDIKPRENPGEAPYVWNWDSPLMISPHNGKRLYFGSRVLHRSDDRGNSWRVVSPDLTRGIDRNQLKVMGVVQKPDAVAKHMSTSIYGNTVALTESPLVENLLYVGTDDGLVNVTEDGGANWRRIENFPVVPEFTYVSDLEASRHAKDRVYAAFDHHKNGDFAPYLLRSDDKGATWKSIAGDLPKNATVYSVVEDHVNADLLFVGTEFGAFFTLDGGAKWMKISGLPTIAVRDVEIQRRENDLVMATFGRGFYIVDDIAPMRSITEAVLESPAAVIPPSRPVWSFVERARVGGGGGRGWYGADWFQAPNPPFGATFTYHLKDKLKTRKELRKEAEGKEGWTYPGIEDFRAEDRERDPVVQLHIHDAGGAVIRRLDVSREAGVHRATWDLRYPSTSPYGGSGMLAPPGAYGVSLVQVVEGVETRLTEPVGFEVRDLEQSPMAVTGAERTEKFEFERRVAELQRAVEGAVRVADDAQERVGALRRAAAETPGFSQDVQKELEALRSKLDAVQVALRGDPTLGKRVVPEPLSIRDRVGIVAGGLFGVTQAPTATFREQYDFAGDEFERVLASLRVLVLTDLSLIEARLEGAKAPWTPGRIPDWKR